jgi:hypothetical protein
VWDRLRSFALEVDPGFSALSVDSLLLHMLGDVFTYSHSLTKLKVVLTIFNVRNSKTNCLCNR